MNLSLATFDARNKPGNNERQMKEKTDRIK
jgi:hypothetical protein